MLILTGTAHSAARPSHGLTTIAVPAAAAPATFKFAPEVSGTPLLDAFGLDGLSKEQAGAVTKPAKAAIASLGAPAKGLLKGIQAYQLTETALTAFRDDGSSVFRRIGATMQAANAFVELVGIAAPGARGLAAFRILEDVAAIGATIGGIHKAATTESEPLLGFRIGPGTPQPRP